METAAELFKKAAAIVKGMPPRLRRQYDEIEVVFLNVVNNRLKSERAYTFNDVLEALQEDSKPIGLILMHWEDPDKMKVEEFPGLSSNEQEVLMHAFAEAQDQAKSFDNIDEE